MGKNTDDKKTKKALARVRRTLRKKDTLEGDAALSEWEDEFIDSLEQRLETFGSAFADPEKGNTDEALSWRQASKLREVEKKARGKARKPMKRSSFKSKKPYSRKPPEHIYDDAPAEPEVNPRPNSEVYHRKSVEIKSPPKLTIISGGKSKK